MSRSGRAFQELMQGLCGRGLANAGSRLGSPLERQVGGGKVVTSGIVPRHSF